MSIGPMYILGLMNNILLSIVLPDFTPISNNYAQFPHRIINRVCTFVEPLLSVCTGVIRVWDMVTGTMSHSLDPLPRPQSTSRQLSMTKEKEGEGEGEEEVPQVYTDLQFSGSRGELVGVTYDHSIIFYDVATFTRQKQVPILTLIQRY